LSSRPVGACGSLRALTSRPTWSRGRLNEGLTTELGAQIVQQFCDEHAERNLLAFVYGHLGDHDLWAVRTEAERDLVLTEHADRRLAPHDLFVLAMQLAARAMGSPGDSIGGCDMSCGEMPVG